MNNKKEIEELAIIIYESLGYCNYEDRKDVHEYWERAAEAVIDAGYKYKKCFNLDHP